jgi:hypothetical protein
MPCIQVQWILRSFAGQRTTVQGGEINRNRGEAYSLFLANCKDFARQVIRVLKENKWTDPGRSQRSFSLAAFEMIFRQKLIREAREYEDRDRADAWNQGHSAIINPIGRLPG